MLVLTRGADEAFLVLVNWPQIIDVVLGYQDESTAQISKRLQDTFGQVLVKVLEVKPTERVRVGVDASPAFSVLRTEIWGRLQVEGEVDSTQQPQGFARCKGCAEIWYLGDLGRTGYCRACRKE